MSTGADPPTNRRDAGLAVRAEVLGEDHVQRSLEQAGDFSRPMQDFVTEYCWGAIWTRDGLDRRTRSLLNIGLLTSMGRMHELKVHTRGAITNGCNTDEIREVLLQAAVYCGVPVALEAFRAVEDTLSELSAESDRGPTGDSG